MVSISGLDPNAEVPLYRQLFHEIKAQIETGVLEDGERLPATRELAGSLGLNRTTVSAAYDLLEAEGLLKGHVGKGSFVSAPRRSIGVRWGDVLESRSNAHPTHPARISFSNSRPSELLFPLEEFRATCTEVIHSEEAQAILQLGSPAGYAPLRRYLLDKALAEGAARPSDDILITSGCQQAFDLLQRTLISNGETVLLEEPVYAGVRNAFQRGGARLVGIPVGIEGIEIDSLERAIARERPRVLAITSNFQNPTGATLPLAKRKALLRITARAGVVVIENDIYGDLRYEGEHVQPVKQLDSSGDTVLLRSFSKLAFPGLRVGWVIGPRALIEKLTEAKQWSDLHTDQLSQAVFLRFAESGRLEEHRKRMLAAGRERLRAVLTACKQHLPSGASFTRPSGGMNLWVRLPEPLDAGELLGRAEREGVTYLPGRFFGVGTMDSRSLRISFAGLAPDKIEAGIATLGRIFANELERIHEYSRLESVPALV
ncbi:MAG: PLP-dependent aminotransferase family protein [Bryobacteraceae bacterium]